MNKGLLRRAIALVAVLAVGFVGGRAIAGGQQLPADKTAVAGATIEDFGPGQEKPILQQRMRISSPADLILGVTLECSILTRLVTNNDQPSDETSGSVDIRITIDGNDVPVQTAGPRAAPAGAADDGSVTFCNRTYQRSVTDQEGDELIDQDDDYIRTKAANAFNWVALNTGVTGYDEPANGNNIIDIIVYASYDADAVDCFPTLDEDESPVSCSEAKVGKRTLVIEPVHAARTEASEPSNVPTTTAPGFTNIAG